MGLLDWFLQHPGIIIGIVFVGILIWAYTDTKKVGKEEQTNPAKVSENKLVLVAKAIMDAKQVTPAGEDVIVYIKTSGVLHEIYINYLPIYIRELKGILVKLQDDEKVITIRSFPKFAQPPDGRDFTLEMSDELIDRTLNPQSFNFTVDVLNTFDKWYKKLSANLPSTSRKEGSPN